jgi:hypothetical protein
MPRTFDGIAEPVYYPDADIENADWSKKSWDFPPYRSAEFFDAIGGVDKLEDFKTSPAYKMAVARGLIHDDEWVLDWCTPVATTEPEHDAADPHRPGKSRRGSVHVHVHRGK